MAANPDLLRRLYGEKPPPPRDPRVQLGSGVLPLFWIAGLLLALICSVVAALGTLFLAATTGIPELERWGVIGADEFVLAAHDHSTDGDGTAGCAVSRGPDGPRVVRWDAREVTAEVALRGAIVTTDPVAVHVSNGVDGVDGGAATVDCPFAADDPTGFVATARTWAATR